MEKDENPNLEALGSNLESWRREYEECAEEERAAARRATEALNGLNEAQKAFDQGVETLKSRHPWSSDWRRERKSGHQVPDPNKI